MISSEQTVADVMLRSPKALTADATVGAAREILGRSRIRTLLLVEGDVFVGAVTAIPESAADEEPALAYADPESSTIAAETSAADGLELLKRDPQGRLVALDDERALLGLLCLNGAGTGFCATPRPEPARPT